MKTKLTFEFNSIDEAQSFLSTVGGGQKVEVSATTTTAEPVGAVAEELPLSKRTVAQLKELCAQRGLPYSSNSKKADLVAILEGRLPEAPAVETPVAVPQPAPVAEPALAVPPAQVTPVQPVAQVVGAPQAEVQPAPQPVAQPAPQSQPQVDPAKQPIIDSFLNVYGNGERAGIPKANLDQIVGQQVVAFGYPAGTGIGSLPVETLQAVVQNFTAHVNHQLQGGQPAIA